MLRTATGLFAAAVLALASECGGPGDAPPPDAAVPTDAPLPSARRVSMDYASERFYAAPFPGEHLRAGDGTVDVSGAPNPYRTGIVLQIQQALRGADGFGTTSPIHFHLDGELDRAQLPTAFSSIEPASPIVLVDVDPSSPERGSRRPFDAYFQSDAGPYGDTFFLTLLPVQGVPLRPSTLYAAVITDALRGADGVPLERT
ncbi:MAG: hypothetical protein M3Y87_24590, partial [Myxococcota bacterium]|nr:hypothetical protein [Myxococcota bacterium]